MVRVRSLISIWLNVSSEADHRWSHYLLGNGGIGGIDMEAALLTRYNNFFDLLLLGVLWWHGEAKREA